MTPHGEQLCYTDAYARHVTARVRHVEAGDATLVVLDRTVFYPGGGGQPSDRGLLLRSSDGRSWTVKAARKLELAADFTFPASPLPWSFPAGVRAKRMGPVNVDTNGDLTPDTLLPGTSNFLPGSSPNRSLSKAYTGECPDPCAGPTCHIDPSTGNTPLPDNFLRPLPGYADIQYSEMA